LAPTRRPYSSGSQQIIDEQGQVPSESEKRSWLSILTLGVL